IQPGARTAIKMTENQKIGVIGTEGTIRSNAYKEALQQIHSELEVTSLACPLFVPMVEKGILYGEQAKQVIEETLRPLKITTNIASLVLGCTHYPIIETTIKKVMGPDIHRISASQETARETSTRLDKKNQLYKGDQEP